MLKKSFYSKGDPHIALLQIRMAPLEPGLLSLATMLFICPIRGIMPMSNRPPSGIDKEKEHYEGQVTR